MWSVEPFYCCCALIIITRITGCRLSLFLKCWEPLCRALLVVKEAAISKIIASLCPRLLSYLYKYREARGTSFTFHNDAFQITAAITILMGYFCPIYGTISYNHLFTYYGIMSVPHTRHYGSSCTSIAERNASGYAIINIVRNCLMFWVKCYCISDQDQA